MGLPIDSIAVSGDARLQPMLLDDINHHEFDVLVTRRCKTQSAFLTKEKRALFASRLRSAHVTTFYAIALCVANALIHGSTTIARYPVRNAVGLSYI